MTQQATHHGDVDTFPRHTEAMKKLAEEYGQQFNLYVSDSLKDHVDADASGETLKPVFTVPEDGECFVTAYSTTQQYGGPEEGGWWYDWSVPIVSVPCLRRDALKIAEYLATRYAPENAVPKGERYTNVNCGEMLELYLEREPGENRSTERPHYE